MQCPMPAFPLALKTAHSLLPLRKCRLLGASHWAEPHAETCSLLRARASELLFFLPGLPCPGSGVQLHLSKNKQVIGLKLGCKLCLHCWFNICSWAHFLYFHTKKYYQKNWTFSILGYFIADDLIPHFTPSRIIAELPPVCHMHGRSCWARWWLKIYPDL